MRFALATLLLATAVPAMAQREDQDEAYQGARSGRIRSLGEILSRIRPEQRRDFLGSEFAPGDRYRLKFMRRGVVENVDVDARTGDVIDGERGRGDERQEYRERRMQEFNDRRSREPEQRPREFEGRDRRHRR